MPEKPTILLVDDDPIIRSTLAEYLELHYQVLRASDGIDAVYVYERNAERVAAIVTDLEMPRLNGQSLEEWVHHIRPDVPVIIMSGTFEKYAIKKLSLRPMTSFLGKPFEVSQLEAMLEMVLTADGQAA